MKPQVDGIFAFNDQLAIGAIEAASEKGLTIPEDLQIIGCGNHPLGVDLQLPLSTIDQDTQKLGEKSAKAILSLLDKTISSPRRVVLKPKLIIRSTSGKTSRKSR